VGVPELHIGRVGRVADVERIEHQDRAVIAGVDCIDEALVPEGAHPFQIGRHKARRGPFREGKLGRSDLHPVVVVWGAIGEARATGGVDLAAFAVGGIHRWLLEGLAHAETLRRACPARNRHFRVWILHCECGERRDAAESDPSELHSRSATRRSNSAVAVDAAGATG
jgi:hypothetical protein